MLHGRQRLDGGQAAGSVDRGGVRRRRARDGEKFRRTVPAAGRRRAVLRGHTVLPHSARAVLFGRRRRVRDRHRRQVRGARPTSFRRREPHAESQRARYTTTPISSGVFSNFFWVGRIEKILFIFRVTLSPLPLNYKL